MNAIQSKYLGPTSYRGSRVKAWLDECHTTVTIPWDSALDPADNHRRAAQELCKAMGWKCRLITGFTGRVYVHLTKFGAGK
jgi:hypothetical protein